MKKISLIKDDFVLIHKLMSRFAKAGFRPSFLREILDKSNHGYVPSPFETDCYAIKILEKGALNENRIIGLVQLKSDWIPTAGFFALFHRTLNGIAFCDRMGFIPVVDKWDGAPYVDDSMSNPSNVYEYYFEQPMISLEEAYHSKNVVIPSSPNMDLVFFDHKCEWFIPSDSYINDMGIIWKKYIRFRKDIEKELITDVKRVLDGKKTLGIHFRGTDRVVNPNGHPKSLTVEDYISLIKHLVSKQNYEQVFLATDDDNALKEFRKSIEGLRYYEDVFRTSGDVAIHFTKVDRANNGYLCGLEILKDTYTLACCDGLVAGISQVSIFARIMKASMGDSYDYLKIISKGMNHNDKEWMEIFYENKQ